MIFGRDSLPTVKQRLSRDIKSSSADLLATPRGTLYEPEVSHGEACWSMHINTSTMEQDLSIHYACGSYSVIETLSLCDELASKKQTKKDSPDE